MSRPAAQSRSYRGVSGDERRAQRRQKLVDAGVELFGTRGYHACSVRDVCLTASLNRRYFYESFGALDELLRAIYDEIVADLSRTVVEAIPPDGDFDARIRAGMEAFWAAVTADPRRARILMIEIIGVSVELETHRREMRHGFAAMIADQMVAAGERDGRPLALDPTLTARGLVATITDLVIDWMRGDVDLSVAQLTAHCITLCELVVRAALGEAPAGAAAGGRPATGGRPPARRR